MRPTESTRGRGKRRGRATVDANDRTCNWMFCS